MKINVRAHAGSWRLPHQLCLQLRVDLFKLPTSQSVFSFCEVWTSRLTSSACYYSSPRQSVKHNAKGWVGFLYPGFTDLQLFWISFFPLLSNRMCQALGCEQISFLLPYWRDELIKHHIIHKTAHKTSHILLNSNFHLWVSGPCAGHRIVTLSLIAMVLIWGALLLKWIEEDVSRQAGANTSFN